MVKRSVVSFERPDESRQERKDRLAREKALLETEKPERVGSADTATNFKGLGWGDLWRARSGWGQPTTYPPVHRATSKTLSVAFPFLNGVGLGTAGVYIGRIKDSGGPFCADPWEWYARKIVTGTSILLIGDIGAGKSSTAKAYVTRQFALGRKCAVVSDPKGEWVPVAHAVGGDVVSIGPGLPNRLNPLDAPLREPGESDDQYAHRVFARRQLLLISVLTTVLGRDLAAAELTVVDVTLGAVTARVGADRVPTLNDVYAEFQEPSQQEALDDPAAIKDLRHGLRRLVVGDLAGMFDGESTVSFDSTKLMTVMDTGAFQSAGEEAKNLATLLASEWLEAAISVRDGSQWNVVYDEGYRMLRNKHQLLRMSDHWKLARHYGLTNILIMHRVSDLDAIGDEQSESRQLALGLLSDTQIKIVGRQEPDMIPKTKSTLGLSDTVAEVIGTLGKGEFVWLVNGRPFLVQTHLTDDERLRVFNTDAQMAAAKTEVPLVPEPVSVEVETAPTIELDSDALASPEVLLEESSPQPAAPVVTPLATPLPALNELPPAPVAVPEPEVSGLDSLLFEELSENTELSKDTRKRIPGGMGKRVALIAASVVAVAGIGIGAVHAVGNDDEGGVTQSAEAVVKVTGLMTPKLGAFTAGASTPWAYNTVAWETKVPKLGAATATNANVVTVTATKLTLKSLTDGHTEKTVKVRKAIKWVASAILNGAPVTAWLDGLDVRVWNPETKSLTTSTLDATPTASQTGANPLMKVGGNTVVLSGAGVQTVNIPEGMSAIAAEDGTILTATQSGKWGRVGLDGVTQQAGQLVTPVPGATLQKWITAGWGSAVSVWAKRSKTYLVVEHLSDKKMATVAVPAARVAAPSVTTGVNSSSTIAAGYAIDLATGTVIADVSNSALVSTKFVGVSLIGQMSGKYFATTDFAHVSPLLHPVAASDDSRAVTVTKSKVTVFTKGVQ